MSGALLDVLAVVGYSVVLVALGLAIERMFFHH